MPRESTRNRSRSSPAARPLTGWPRLGQAWLLDRELGRQFAKIVGGIPDEVTRGVYVTPDDEPLRAGRSDGRQPRRPRQSAHRCRDSRLDHGARPAPRAVHLAREGDQGVRGQPAGGRSGLPRGTRRTRREPRAGRGDPLDGRVVLTGAGRARARSAGRGRRAGGRGPPRRDPRDRTRPAPARPRPARGAGGARSPLRPGDLRLRAGDGGRDRGGVRDARRPAHRRRGAQAHARDRRPVPGRATAWPASHSCAPRTAVCGPRRCGRDGRHRRRRRDRSGVRRRHRAVGSRGRSHPGLRRRPRLRPRPHAAAGGGRAGCRRSAVPGRDGDHLGRVPSS